MRLLLPLLLLPALAEARELEPRPVWDGRFVEGQPTEIAVRLTSPIGGTVEFQASGAAGIVELRVAAEAGRPIDAAVPAYPGPDGKVRVSAQLPDGTQAAAEVRLLRRPERLAVRVTPVATPAAEQGAPPSSEIQDLPRTAAGYRPIASLTLRPVALADLDPAQTAALATYLATCGRLTLAGGTPEILSRVRASAGCSGRFVQAESAASTEPAPALPGTIRLVSILTASEAPPARAMALLLLPYPLLLLSLTASRWLGPWLLVLPPAAALAYGAVLPFAQPAASALTWAEAETGNPSCRFVTLLRTRGGGERPPLHLAADADVMLPGPESPIRLFLSEPAGAVGLALPRQLLVQHDYRVEGARPLPPVPGLDATEGGVGVRNPGPGGTPAGWVLWTGRAYPLPALAGGARHEVHATDPPGDLPFPYLPVGDLGRAPALLFPFGQGTGGDPRLQSAGWLLVRSPVRKMEDGA